MTPSPSPNFAFLGYHDPRLSVLGTEAERLFAEHPRACLGTLRLFGEILAQRAAARLGLFISEAEKQADLLARLSQRGALPELCAQLFRGLRVAGNEAIHAGRGDHQDALHQLKMAHQLGIWFQRAFGNNKKFDPGPFVPPPDPALEDAALREQLEALRTELSQSKIDADAARAAAEAEARARLGAEQLAEKLEQERQVWEALAEDEARRSKEALALQAQLAAELLRAQEQAAAQAPAVIQAAVDRASEAGDAIALSEADTRHIIDQQLREAGWEADSQALLYKAGARPEKGRSRAIAEWPTTTGPVDYALFVGLEVLAVAEAKKMSVDVPSVLQQATRYARSLVVEGEARFAGGPSRGSRTRSPTRAPSSTSRPSREW